MDQSSIEIMFTERQDSSDANSVDSGFSMDSGMMTIHEVFDNDFSSNMTKEKLFNELQRVKDDLHLKEKEIRRANELRENTDREIEELTASLFQSAHSMVDEAKQAQANAEEKLKHSNQTIDALTLENIQLKKTVNELKSILNSCRSSIDMSTENTNMDHFLAREYFIWQENPSLERDFSLFMHRIYYEDILPCLTFPNADLSSKILASIENNHVIMEACHSKENIKNCSLMGELCPCDYRIQINENSEWYPLCRLARNRIASVCDFFTFLRHVQSGLVKSDLSNRFKKITQLRQQMAFARLGL